MSFKKEDKDAAKIYQNIGPDQTVEADHIIPRSKGGKNDVEP